jgi:hypothetical protein
LSIETAAQEQTDAGPGSLRDLPRGEEGATREYDGRKCLIIMRPSMPRRRRDRRVKHRPTHARWRGLKVARYLTGSLVTSLDMAGCSLTVSLLDEPLIRLWDAPVKTAALSW